MLVFSSLFFFFFFNDPAPTEIYPLSLHAALPICPIAYGRGGTAVTVTDANLVLGRLNPDRLTGVAAGAPICSAIASAILSIGAPAATPVRRSRSEEHTSELQSRQYLVCRLLLEKK